jgi:hypothetical protein
MAQRGKRKTGAAGTGEGPEKGRPPPKERVFEEGQGEQGDEVLAPKPTSRRKERHPGLGQ